jgi:hypothetical protein
MIMNIWKPEQYHGFNKKNNFFEGWYYKSVSEDNSSILIIIPGIFKSKDKTKEHAFIQFLDGITGVSHYIRFNSELFSADPYHFEIQIDNCMFSLKGLTLDIERDDFRAFGEIRFENVIPWTIKTFSPGAMGWYGLIPIMECFHGILSFNHFVSGKMLINREVYLYTKGKGYIEKDWGTSFPSSYLWMQSNHFKDTNISFTASIANIPWFFSSFTGFIIGLLYKDKLYRFATYTGAKFQNLEITDEFAKFTVEDSNNILSVNTKRAAGGQLHAPYKNDMSTRIVESLNAIIDIKLYKKVRNKIELVIEDTGINSGIEIVGNLKQIV